MDVQTKQRTLTQRDKILKLLRENKEYGVTNSRLQEVAYRYNARMQELYQLGYVIETTYNENGLTVYKLLEEPKVERRDMPNAIEILAKEIQDCGNRVTSEELIDLLSNLNLTVRRKMNTVKKTIFNT